MSRVLELNMVPIYRPDSGMLLAGQEMQAAHLWPSRSGPKFAAEGPRLGGAVQCFRQASRSAMVHATSRMRS